MPAIPSSTPPRPIDRARLTWALRALAIDELWRRGLTGAGVRIGHLDTGVAGAHPALAGRIARFCEVGADGEPAGSSDPRDTGSHGTHTAGILCGGTLDGTPDGEAIGAAPDAALCAAAVIDGGDSVVRILRGLNWLRGAGVRVISMPLGIPGDNPVLWPLLESLRAGGALAVGPIGNLGSTRPLAPASYPHVLAVGAVDDEGALARYTGCVRDPDGTCVKPEVLAPGVAIRSAHPRSEDAAARGGTSQASAFVAGVAALLFQAHPNATPGQVERALIGSARPVHPRHRGRCRSGVIDPLGALELLDRTIGSGDPSPEPIDPPRYRDPELMALRRGAPPDARRSAVAVVSRRAACDGRRGPAGGVVDRIAGALAEPPDRVEYLPAGRVAIVRGSPRWIDALDRDPDVVVLGACAASHREVLRGPW